MIGSGAAGQYAFIPTVRPIPPAVLCGRQTIMSSAVSRRHWGRRRRSEAERRTDCDHPRVRSEASVAIIENAAAWTDDILHVGLKRPPRRQLGYVHHFDNGFSGSHRIEKACEEPGVGIEPPRIIPNASIGCGDPDLVVRSARYEAFVHQASIGIEIDQIAIVRYATARANKAGQALVVGTGNAIEHLIDNTVDAGVSSVVERNSGRRRVRE